MFFSSLISPNEQFVSDLNQEFKIKSFQNLAPPSNGCSADIASTPPIGLNFLFEESLNALGAFEAAASF